MVEKIVDMLLNYVEPDDEITAETNIKTQLGMTSFDLICFGDDLYNEFKVRLTPDNFRNCLTVGDLANFIENNK